MAELDRAASIPAFSSVTWPASRCRRPCELMYKRPGHPFWFGENKMNYDKRNSPFRQSSPRLKSTQPSDHAFLYEVFWLQPGVELLAPISIARLQYLENFVNLSFILTDDAVDHLLRSSCCRFIRTPSLLNAEVYKRSL